MQIKFIILSVLFSIISVSNYAQNNNFQYKVLNINFSEKQDDFPIVRENDNYFIIDENEYLILRENNESEYVIILEESYTDNSLLKSAFKLGPSENINSSIGFIIRANKDFSEALIIEVNNDGKYRIKQFKNNNYSYLSKKNRKGKWIKSKSINKENIYNTIEIIDNKNKITFKSNNSIVEEFESNINKKGYSGILIGPDTKSRLKYFYLNTDKQEQIQIKKEKIQEVPMIKTNEKVIANYYEDIAKGLLDSALKLIPKSNFIKIIKVPGVFEIPVTISKNIKKYDAFLALGCVIKGETPHFDFISQASTNAIMDLSIRNQKPIGNGIITCLNMRQAKARKKKGAEAAQAVISVLSQK